MNICLFSAKIPHLRSPFQLVSKHHFLCIQHTFLYFPPTPTVKPTAEPTATPTVKPTAEPTAAPTVSNKVEFTKDGDRVNAKIILDKPVSAENIKMYPIVDEYFDTLILSVIGAKHILSSLKSPS